MKRTILVILIAACAASAASADGPPVPEPPRPRIVSFSPALTLILFDMGLGDNVVGVTRFCRLPEGVDRTRVGDAFTVTAETILAVRPDLILTQSTAGKFKGVCELDPHVRVEVFELERLADVSAAVDRIGALAGRADLARQVKSGLESRLAEVRSRVSGLARPRVLLVMGTDRPRVAGPETFLGDLIVAAGGVNAAADIPGRTRWYQTHADAVIRAAPEVLICQTHGAGSEQEARRYWLQWRDIPAARTGRVYVTSDPDWSIPSARLADLASELAELLHPEAFAATRPVAGRPATLKRPDVGFVQAVTLRQVWFRRLLAAALVGAALAAAGAALQGLLRNPLAEPYILGVSSGAGVGVLLGMALASWYALPEWASTTSLAMIGAIATCAVVYAVAQRRGRLDSYSLILAGVIVNAFNGAIMLATYLYIDPHRIPDFAYWAMGKVPDAPQAADLWAAGACVLLGWGVLLLRGSAFNVLGLGDAVAESSGVVVWRLRAVTFAAVGLMTAAAVAVAGPIGFLGLIVPHICRMLVGPDHRKLILVSGVAGAVFLSAAEVLCRTAGPLLGVSLIPVGIITALCGGPFFIVLMRRRLREGAA